MFQKYKVHVHNAFTDSVIKIKINHVEIEIPKGSSNKIEFDLNQTKIIIISVEGKIFSVHLFSGGKPKVIHKLVHINGSLELRIERKGFSLIRWIFGPDDNVKVGPDERPG